MTRRAEMERLLSERFSPAELQVTDDSHAHAGHAGARPGGNTHFTVHIVAEAFRGKPRIECHRMVYEALSEHFADGLHALAIRASAPERA